MESKNTRTVETSSLQKVANAAAGGDEQTEYLDELTALQTVVSVLKPLHPQARGRVISYVNGLFGEPGAGQTGYRAQGPSTFSDTSAPPVHPQVDIRSLTEQKAPRSAVEMAVVVGYYLSEVAPKGERSPTVGTQEIERYFKQAGFPVPAKPRNVLFAAAEAGYMNSVERGQYRLTPVGYNLVVFRMPNEASTPKMRVRNARVRKRKPQQGAEASITSS